jgi:hypothetical protein
MLLSYSSVLICLHLATPNRFHASRQHVTPAAWTQAGRTFPNNHPDNLDVIASEPVLWEPVNPVVSNEWQGTTLSGKTLLVPAFSDPRPWAIPVTQPNGRRGYVTTPATLNSALPTPAVPTTPMTTPAAVLAAQLPQASGLDSIPVFPKHLPAGSVILNARPDLETGGLWVPHPAPGPHLGNYKVAPNAPNTQAAFSRISPVQGGVPQPQPMLHTAAIPVAPTVGPVIVAPPAVPLALDVRLSPLVGYNTIQIIQPHVKWDIADMPDRRTVKKVTGRNVITDYSKSEFQSVAVDAPGMQMVIHVEHRAWPLMSQMWGPIVVEASNHKTNTITAMDVFNAVYEYFQVQIFENDKQHIYHDQNDPNYLTLRESWYRRCKTSLTTVPAAELRLGLKRVDMLGDVRRWFGELKTCDLSLTGVLMGRFVAGLQKMYGPNNTIQFVLFLGNLRSSYAG